MDESSIRERIARTSSALKLLSRTIHFTRICKLASFWHSVDVGKRYKTILDVDDTSCISQFQNTISLVHNCLRNGKKSNLVPRPPMGTRETPGSSALRNPSSSPKSLAWDRSAGSGLGQALSTGPPIVRSRVEPVQTDTG